MIAKKIGNLLEGLYEKDETAWLEQNARLIKERKVREIDYKHLAEYLNDMAKRDKREVTSRLVTLMAHLLKAEFQSWKRSSSWDVTMMVQRHDLEDLLESQTLANYAKEVLPKAYAKAVKEAAAETGLDKDRFPPSCPYTVEGLLED